MRHQLLRRTASGELLVLAVREGRLTEALDGFSHPFWDTVRANVAGRAMEVRRQGFFGAAMLAMS